MLRRFVLGVSAFALVSAGPLTSEAAHADPIPPYNCSTFSYTQEGGWAPPEGGAAWCSAGHGWVRVVIRCVDDFNKGATLSGPWKRVPNWPGNNESHKSCTSTYPYLTRVSYETQSL
jgi:hypothetical protein